MIFLDTCYLIRALVPASDEDVRLREWIRAGESLAISSVAWAEFLCGPLGPDDAALAEKIISRRSVFDAEAARLAAVLLHAGGRRRGSLLDCMVAAVAILEGARLATTNEEDFRRFEGQGLQLL